MTPRERKLRKLLRALPEADQAALVAFAEFLHARAKPPRDAAARVLIPRPEQESVVGAIKRLSASYPMVDKAEMLDETSHLMAQHVMHGRAANEVIDELEAIFRRHYETLLAESDGKP